MRIDAADVGALLMQGTLAALWPLRVADLPAVLDQADVQDVDPVGRRDPGEDGVGLVRVDLGADEAEPLADPPYMGVYTHLQLGVLHIASAISSMLSRG